MKIKTVFISCFFNLVGRNILGTEFFSLLTSNNNVNVILLVPKGKGAFFENAFGGLRVTIEEIEIKKSDFINLILHLIFWNLLNTSSKTIHRAVELGQSKNLLIFLIKTLFARLGSLKIAVRLFRWLDYKIVSGGGYDVLFERYKPDVVFVTDIQDLRFHQLSDSYLLREARRKGIKTMAMSRSWDSMTTKGLMRTLPDVLVVQNDNIKHQAFKYHMINMEKVSVVGIPHYDFYLKGVRTDRKIFFDSLKFNSNKKLILFVPPSEIWTKDKTLNRYLLKMIQQTGEQIIVRFPIFGGMDMNGIMTSSDVFFDEPQNASRLEESVLDQQGDAHLADSIYYSDVVVTGPSSLMLDAAIFDKPIVLIGFDGEKKKPSWQRLDRYYNYEHQKDFLDSGFAKIAKNSSELVDFIKIYLKFPELGHEARRKVANSISCLDGKSGARLFAILKDLLDK